MPLFITRHVGQAVMIDDDIEIRVTRITRGQITLLINAPKERKVWREEIYEQLVNDARRGNK